MALKGPAFYDNDSVFNTYGERRRRLDNPNDTLEKPVFVDLMGLVQGKRVLDLGCGDASFGRELLDQGCLHYVGVEGSTNMVAAASRVLEGTPGRVVQADLEQWPGPQDQFDLAISRLALHYLENLDEVCSRVYGSLVPGGRFIFSVEHPVITSCDRGWQESGGGRQAWLVDDYFQIGRRETAWMGGQVVKYHRTVEEYFLMLQRAGFSVESLRESHPQRRWFQDEATYQRRWRIPLFLFMAARK